MDISQLVNQLQTIVLLYSEIIVCVAGAGIFGLVIGLMMQRSKHKRQIASASDHWKTRYKSLETSSRIDAANLEEQLQSMAMETKNLQEKNKTLADTLKKNDSNFQQARAESIELNRQHADTHERLQLLIQQKDQELATLNDELNKKSKTPTITSNVTAASSLKTINTAIADSDIDNADTVALTPAQSSDLSKGRLLEQQAKEARKIKKKRNRNASIDPDSTLDDTSDLNELGLEESTVAMDEDALSFIQQSFKTQSRD